MLRRGVLALLLLLVCACGADGVADGETSGSSRAGARGLPPAIDSDDDGLCDSREQELGTDPDSADSDGDGLPDLPELVNGFDPTNTSTPASDQIGYLAARRDATVDFPIRATVEGSGESISGVFQSLPSLDPAGFDAGDFFRGVQAISADPIDGVRSIDGESGRFASVLGKTRLGFNLRFEYSGDAVPLAPIDCVREYPFRFAIKTDTGRVRADRLFLLLVAPESTTAGNVEHCRPEYCQ